MILRRNGSARKLARVLRRRARRAAALFAALAAVAGVVAIAPAARSATGTTVSLTFDNNTLSQYTLGYQQALQPHGVNPTFYVSSGSVSNSSSTK